MEHEARVMTLEKGGEVAVYADQINNQVVIGKFGEGIWCRLYIGEASTLATMIDNAVSQLVNDR